MVSPHPPSARCSARRGAAGACLPLLLLLALPPHPAAALTFTDAAQRRVEVPLDVGAVVPATVPAQVLVEALAPGKLAGLAAPFAPEHAIYVDEALLGLPQIPLLIRTDAPGDVATVAALHPSLVVAYGPAGERAAAAAEAIQAELRAPTVLLSDDLAEAAATARRLGRVMGAADRGERVAALIADALARTAPLARLPDAQRVPVYLARGGDGLAAARAGGPYDEAIRLAGGRNVVAAGDGDFRAMSVAEVAALKPKVVIVGESEATHGALRDAMPEGTRFVLDAGEPYPVLLGPRSINRVAGVLALAAILHPDTVKPDPEEAARIEAALFPIPPGLSLPSPLQPR